jgi:DHA2 family multidrug resistance protein
MGPKNKRHKIELNQELNWPVITILIIGTFMAILDSSIVNVALPKMMAVFGANTDTIEWVVTAYMLSMGVVMPLSGFLGDTFGYKRCYIASLALFVTGSALCGFAWSMNALIVARVIQALGGGILMPLGMAILYKICPRGRIGEVLGVWGISAMAAPAIGPTLGGYLVQFVDWRMIFYLNVPIGIINLYLAYTTLGETDLIKGKQFDLVGIILSSIGFFTLLLALSEGAKDGWGTPFIVGLLIAAVISLTAFVINELGHPEPILQLRLFQNYVFTVATFLSCILAIGMFAIIFLLPIMIQDIFGQTPLKCGLILFPGAIASGLIMPFSGWFFDRYGAKGIVITGIAIITVTTYAMHTFSDLTPFWYITMLMMIRGAGMGLAMMPVMNVGMNAAPAYLVGRASATINVVRQVSASLGIAILTTIMQDRQVFHASVLAEAVNSSTSNAALAMREGLQSLAHQFGVSVGLSPALGLGLIFYKIELLSTIQAIDDCFMVAAAMCLFALFVSFFLVDDVKKRQVAHIESSKSSQEENIIAMEV